MGQKKNQIERERVHENQVSREGKRKYQAERLKQGNQSVRENGNKEEPSREREGG